MTFDFLMTDHPAWQSDGSHHVRAMLLDSGGVEVVEIVGCKVATAPSVPSVDVFALPSKPLGQARPLYTSLLSAGAVARMRTPSLWEALGTAIIRQVIRAAQARRLYREFCHRFGDRIALSEETGLYAFPSPERVLTLSDDSFTESGMAFKRRALRHAAAAFLAHRSSWLELAPSVLVKELQTVSGIGPWSAGAAVADWSHDWSLYPYGDLAVRTWARHASPNHPWPSEESAFVREWRRVTGEQLALYTVLTLAHGTRHAAAL